jgi:hypothetical protein
MVVLMENKKSASALWLGVQFALTGVALLVAIRLMQGHAAGEIISDPLMLFRGLFGRS